MQVGLTPHLTTNLKIWRRAMASMNKVQIIGYLGKDPELRYTSQQIPVATFSVGTSEQWVDKSGAKQQQTEWMNVVVWNKLAENCSKYLTKGRQVYVEGKFQTRKWKDKEGNDRYTTEVVAREVLFLGQGNGEKTDRVPPQQHDTAKQQPQAHTAALSSPEEPLHIDDIPF